MIEDNTIQSSAFLRAGAWMASISPLFLMETVFHATDYCTARFPTIDLICGIQATFLFQLILLIDNTLVTQMLGSSSNF